MPVIEQDPLPVAFRRKPDPRLRLPAEHVSLDAFRPRTMHRRGRLLARVQGEIEHEDLVDVRPVEPLLRALDIPERAIAEPGREVTPPRRVPWLERVASIKTGLSDVEAHQAENRGSDVEL